MLRTPILITNFKNYEAGVGQNAVRLAKIHQEVARDTGASIAVAVNACDIYRVSQAVNIPVLAQHVDPIDYGSFTGKILPQGIKRAGAVGTLLNHSENRLDFEVLVNTIAYAQKSSLIRIICVESPEEVEQVVPYDPDFIAFEPPELIGSNQASVASAKPQSIKESVAASSGIPILVGAGISSPKDIEISLSLGAKGFLIASSIVKSRNPEKVLRSFVEVF